MIRPLAAAALALSLGAAGCVHGRGTPQEPLVDAVVFHGVKAVDEDALAEGLATRGPVARGGITDGLVKDRQRFEPDALPTDVKRVEAFYRDRGYYAATVDDPVVEEAGPGLVRVVFTVHEGRPARVTKLEVEGLDAAPEAKKKLGALPLRVGDVFRVTAYDAARAAILAALQNNGWATGEVTQDAVVLPEEGAVEVTYHVKAGLRYRVGAIFVGRIEGITPRRIQEQVAAVLKTGDWWDESKLVAARRRLADLGVFGAVRVTRATPDDANGTIPVVIDLRQAKYQTIRVGPGIGLDPARWDLELQVGWQHRNFLGDLRRLSVNAKGGWAWVPTPFSANKQGPVGTFTVDFSQPGALAAWLDASVTATLERGIEQAYNYVGQRLKLATPFRLVSHLMFVPSLNLEVYELSDYTTPPPTGQPLPPGSTEPVLQNCTGKLCLLVYFEQLIAWDARDNPISARSGWYAGLALQEGLDLSGYGYRYLRFQPELRAFLPLSRRTVAAFRARVGGLIPVNETGAPPIVARFYAGGALSMRGYYQDRFSPMIWQNNAYASIGANGAVDGSAELRIDLGGSLGGVLFVDTAGVSNTSGDPAEYQRALDATQWQWAAGIGARYRTPFGPIRLDLGVRLPTDYRAGVPFNERFPAVPFVTGADGQAAVHREPIVAIQLALGEAF